MLVHLGLFNSLRMRTTSCSQLQPRKLHSLLLGMIGKAPPLLLAVCIDERYSQHVATWSPLVSSTRIAEGSPRRPGGGAGQSDRNRARSSACSTTAPQPRFVALRVAANKTNSLFYDQSHPKKGLPNSHILSSHVPWG